MSVEKPIDLQSKLIAFFEPTLEDMGVGETQIELQTLEELRVSLSTLDQAIGNPSEFSELNVDITAHGLPILVKQPESKLTFRILPTLLSRKRLVLDRIRGLEQAVRPSNLDDLLNSLDDEKARSELKRELLIQRNETERWERQASQTQEAIVAERTTMEAEISKLSKNKVKVDSARVTIIAAILGLVGVLGGAMLNNYTELFGVPPKQSKLEVRVEQLEGDLAAREKDMELMDAQAANAIRQLNNMSRQSRPAPELIPFLASKAIEFGSDLNNAGYPRGASRVYHHVLNMITMKLPDFVARKLDTDIQNALEIEEPETQVLALRNLVDKFSPR